MRLVIDLDGTICKKKKDGQRYSGVLPKKGAAESIRKLRAKGHYIIIYTSRHMKTCNHNPGQVLARIGKITLDWLDRNGVEYDEIVFGKPLGDLYIDDSAIKFSTWKNIEKRLR